MKTSYPKLKSIKWKNGVLADNVLVTPKYGQITMPADNALRGAYEQNLKEVAIVGYDAQGNEHIFSNSGRYEETAYMFSRGHLAMMRIEDD